MEIKVQAKRQRGKANLEVDGLCKGGPKANQPTEGDVYERVRKRRHLVLPLVEM